MPESRAHARKLSVSSTIHPKMVDFRTASATSGWDIRGDRAHLAGPSNGNRCELASEESDDRSEPPPARAAFAERFSFDQPNPPNSSWQRSSLSASFDDRHIGDILPSSAAISSAPVAPTAAAPRALRRRQFLCRVRLRSDHPNPDFSSPVHPRHIPVSLAYAPSHSGEELSNSGFASEKFDAKGYGFAR